MLSEKDRCVELFAKLDEGAGAKVTSSQARRPSNREGCCCVGGDARFTVFCRDEKRANMTGPGVTARIALLQASHLSDKVVE